MKISQLLLLGSLGVAAMPAQATICGPDQMQLRGSFNGWTSTPMSCDTDAAEWVGTVTLESNAEFKFDVMGDWVDNHGDNAPADGFADQGGDNIQVADAGEYNIRYDYRSKEYSVTPVGGGECGVDTMYIRGSFNGWAADAMSCVDGVFTASLNASSATQFKFDQFADWTVNYGDNNPSDPQVDQGGNNIQVDAGVYDIAFDVVAGTYTIESDDPGGQGTVILNLNNRVWNYNEYQVVALSGSPDYWLDDAQPQMPQMPDGEATNGQVTLTLDAGEHLIQIGCLCASVPEAFYLSEKLPFNVVAGTTTTYDLEFQLGRLVLEVDADTVMGEGIYVTGESEELGAWATAKPLTYVNGAWRYNGLGQPTTEFKLIKAPYTGEEISTSGNVDWQQGSNNEIMGTDFLNQYKTTMQVSPLF